MLPSLDVLIKRAIAVVSDYDIKEVSDNYGIRVPRQLSLPSPTEDPPQDIASITVIRACATVCSAMDSVSHTRQLKTRAASTNTMHTPIASGD